MVQVLGTVHVHEEEEMKFPQRTDWKHLHTPTSRAWRVTIACAFRIIGLLHRTRCMDRNVEISLD